MRKILPYLNSPAITPLLLTRLTYVPSFISSENVKRASDDEPCTSLYLLVKSDSFLSAFQGTPVFAAKCSAVLRPCYSMRISISWRWLDRSNMAAQLTYLRTVNASSSFLYMSRFPRLVPFGSDRRSGLFFKGVFRHEVPQRKHTTNLYKIQN